MPLLACGERLPPLMQGRIATLKGSGVRLSEVREVVGPGAEGASHVMITSHGLAQEMFDHRKCKPFYTVLSTDIVEEENTILVYERNGEPLQRRWSPTRRTGRGLAAMLARRGWSNCGVESSKHVTDRCTVMVAVFARRATVRRRCRAGAHPDKQRTHRAIVVHPDRQGVGGSDNNSRTVF